MNHYNKKNGSKGKAKMNIRSKDSGIKSTANTC